MMCEIHAAKRLLFCRISSSSYCVDRMLLLLLPVLLYLLICNNELEWNVHKYHLWDIVLARQLISFQDHQLLLSVFKCSFEKVTWLSLESVVKRCSRTANMEYIYFNSINTLFWASVCFSSFSCYFHSFGMCYSSFFFFSFCNKNLLCVLSAQALAIFLLLLLVLVFTFTFADVLFCFFIYISSA